MLVELAKCPDEETMMALLSSIRDEGLQREDAREIKRARKEPTEKKTRPFVFKYQPEGQQYRISMQFKKTEVDRAEVIGALRDLAQKLEDEGAETEGQ